MDHRNTQEDGLDSFVQGVVELIDAQADHAGQDAVAGPGSFATVASRLMRIRQRRGRERLAAACVGCAVVAGLVGFWIRPHWADRQPVALTYTVNGQLPSRGSDIAAGSVAEPVLSFSDGTRIQLGPRARGRVVEIGPHGARIALEEGKARVEVAHRAGAQWVFEAGPFLIGVHGTAFSFGWSARDSRLDVKMDSGVVSVTGPLSGGEIFLRAGQTLSVSLNDQGAPKTEDAPGPRSASTSPALAPPAPTGEPSQAPRRAERAAPRAAAMESWVAKLSDGKAAAVVADARRMGLAKVLDSSSSEDLAALADASRYERNDGLARSALLAQRRRFPHSMRASEASFLLGRLDDTSDAGAERALRWYDAYLGEAPRGAYVSEALGRKMMVLERTNRHTEATAIAADYLRRFPGGTYSHAAQALTRTL